MTKLTRQEITTALGIPTFNRGHVLLDTINQALAQDPRADEIIVVDQSDWYPEGAREQLERLASEGKIRYFRQDTPNLPMARNRILREAVTDIVIFVDDDVCLSPGFIAAHRANYADTEVLAVCGRLTEEGIASRPLVSRTWLKVGDYREFDASWLQRIENFGTLKGCNHSVRVDAARRLGGYDVNFTGVALCEEVDLALRILKNDGCIVFDPTAHLHHLRAPAGGCRVSQWGDWTAGLCRLRFALKHRVTLGRYFWREIWHAYRLGVLHRNTVKRPWVVLGRSVRFMITALTMQCD